MIERLPWYVPLAIVLVNATFWVYWMTGLSAALKRKQIPNATKKVAIVGAVFIAWLILQGALGYVGFYRNGTSPRFLYGITPPLLAIAVVLLWSRVRRVLEAIPLGAMTYIHTVRTVVELVVWALFVHQMTPKLMTFAGLNFDIAIGMTAPVIGYFCFTKKVWSPKVALVWHICGLAFLANVSILFIFSVSSPFQLFHGEYENAGFFFFPFIWAPTHGVPTVILTHCIAISRLWRLIRDIRD
jgi:hypothetical protein